ncbi:MAG: haloacid dehalogenase-like hydrolase [Firmicutes bacterium]|nr:haloacid dehalogenase-like hydrolase [Bacillota bacterium]
MNVYDFDGTIFPKDCSVDFFLWCLKRRPLLWLTYVPRTLVNLFLRKIKVISECTLQRNFFGYLTKIKDLDVQLERYWDKNEKYIAPWYLAQKKDDDLIISASPICIIAPIANRLGVKYVATDFELEYGVFLNNMMYAKEKARYIIEHGFPVIENFYSDSLSDTPLALCAEKAHWVKNFAGTVVDWPDLNEKNMKVVKKKIDSGWSVHLKE